MASKYDSRRIWMNTGASAKLKNFALEEATVRRTKKIYQQATRDIEAQVAQIYSQLGVLARNNRWEFPGLKNPATKKDMSALIKAVDKAGLTDYVPEALTKRMNVIEVKQMNIWLKIQEAGQKSHEATKEAILKTMQNSGKAWAGALAVDADSFVGFDRNICGYMMGMNWEDGNFSSRLWNASNETWEKVRDELTRAMANGQQPETTKAHLRRILSEAHNPEARGSGGISYDVERIIRTESAKAATQADLARWREAGVDKVQWHATFEKGTCVHCADRDGRIYKLEEAMLDEPPLHPNCRCYFAAYDEVAAKFPDTTYYKNDNGDYTEIQWAPYHSVIDSAGQLRSKALKVSDYFWKTSPWTTYKSPKTGINYKGEIDNQVKDMTERTIQALSDQYPEIRERLKKTYNDEITLHRGSSVIIGNKLDEIGGLADPAYHQLTIAYLDKATGGSPLSQMAAQAKNQYKKDFWSTPKDNHTIVHELGHVLANDLKSTRGIDAEQLILRATGKKNWKQAKAVLEGDISRYAAKNPEEAFAELFARTASQDVTLQNKTTARFADALEEARKQPKKRTQITIKEISKVGEDGTPAAKTYTTESGWINSLTAGERNAVEAYVNDHATTGYTDINDTLREGKYRKGYRAPTKDGWQKASDLRLEDATKAVENLDTAIAKFTLTSDKTVWRGLSESMMSEEFQKKLDSLKPGSILTDKAYTSTAVTKSGTAEFGYSYIMKIKVPAGTGRGIYTRKLSDYQSENELLLKRDAQFMVTKVGTTTNAYGDKVKLIEVEMQAPEKLKTTKPAAIKMSGTETKELTDNQIIELAYDDLRQNYDTRDVMYRIAKERKIDGTPKVVTDEEFKALDEKEYTKYTRGITDDNFRNITKEQVHEQTMRGNYRVSESFRSTIGQGYYITEKAEKSRYFAELGLLQGESGAVEEIALPKTMQMLDLRKETDRKKLEKMEKDVTELNDRIAARYKKVDFTSNDPEASKQAHYLNVYEYAAAKGYDGIIGSDEEAVLFNRADAIINKELKDEKKPKNWRTEKP